MFGLIVGLVARFFTPGRTPRGFLVTSALGIVGSVLGGFLGRGLGLYSSTTHTGGFIMSFLGAVLVLVIVQSISGRREAVRRRS